jgi:hypothetical protein
VCPWECAHSSAKQTKDRGSYGIYPRCFHVVIRVCLENVLLTLCWRHCIIVTNRHVFQDLPEELRDLSAVENDLMALRLSFMKVRASDPSVWGGPKTFGQLCLSGMVINVPTDLGRIQTELPQQVSADETVLLFRNQKRNQHTGGAYSNFLEKQCCDVWSDLSYVKARKESFMCLPQHAHISSCQQAKSRTRLL